VARFLIFIGCCSSFAILLVLHGVLTKLGVMNLLLTIVVSLLGHLIIAPVFRAFFMGVVLVCARRTTIFDGILTLFPQMMDFQAVDAKCLDADVHVFNFCRDIGITPDSDAAKHFFKSVEMQEMSEQDSFSAFKSFAATVKSTFSKVSSCRQDEPSGSVNARYNDEAFKAALRRS